MPLKSVVVVGWFLFFSSHTNSLELSLIMQARHGRYENLAIGFLQHISRICIGSSEEASKRQPQLMNLNGKPQLDSLSSLSEYQAPEFSETLDIDLENQD